MPRALIVDDSKTAQARLKWMLRRYALEIDFAFSGEEALGFLSYNTPDVIFLDHHMEGMDGLEALRILKANPATAMIPVVMYTSEKGDVYVGQARALGALDILSKEVIQPANLQRLLSSLKIDAISEIENKTDKARASIDAGSDKPKISPGKNGQGTTANDNKHSDDQAVLGRRYIDEIRAQVARLFELHIADVRQQISDQSRFVVRNLRSEIREINKSLPKKSEEEEEFQEIDDLPIDNQFNFIPAALALLAFLAFVYLGYEVLKSQQSFENLEQRYSVLEATTLKTQQDAAELLALMKANNEKARDVIPPKNNQFDIADVVEWAIDSDLNFAFNEEPLSEVQVSKIQHLVQLLDRVGFRGEIELDIQFANLCVTYNDQSLAVLPLEGTSFISCALLADSSKEFSVGDFVSLAYIQFEQGESAINRGDIIINLRTSGVITREPTLPSPAAWNAHALKDNRIHVMIVPRG